MEVQEYESMPAPPEGMFDDPKRPAEEEDDDMVGPKKKKQKVGNQSDIDEAMLDPVFIRLKNELFLLFHEKRALDITLPQFEKHLRKAEVDVTAEEIEKCLLVLCDLKKIVREGKAIFLTA